MRGRRGCADADQYGVGDGRRLAASASAAGQRHGGLERSGDQADGAYVASTRWPGPYPLPIVGVGGIASIDDVMEFLVAGATAVQIGTANFYNPTVSMQILDELPGSAGQSGARQVADVVGSLRGPGRSDAALNPTNRRM